MQVALIDYGAGNLTSVRKALRVSAASEKAAWMESFGGVMGEHSALRRSAETGETLGTAKKARSVHLL